MSKGWRKREETLRLFRLEEGYRELTSSPVHDGQTGESIFSFK